MNGKQKVSICFLLLHFNDETLTYRAVDSLLQLNKIEYCKIVIIDNGSRNNSGSKIEKKYRGYDNIDVVLLDKNNGFSKGNNIGYQYITKKYNFDFVIAINNDILFNQKDFIIKLYNEYKKTGFNVAGPDIFVPQRYWHSSPLREKVMTEDELNIYLQNWYSWIKKYKCFFSFQVLKVFLLERFRFNSFLIKLYYVHRKLKGNPTEYETIKTNCVLQGSCLIFDQKFCLNNANLFEPETFLYEEENILTLKCLSDGWKIFYLPNLQVYHTCQGSTQIKKQSYRDFCKRKINEHKYLIEATKIYIKYMKDLNLLEQD